MNNAGGNLEDLTLSFKTLLVLFASKKCGGDKGERVVQGQSISRKLFAWLMI